MKAFWIFALALALGLPVAHAGKSTGEVVDDAILHSRVKAALVGQDVLSGLGINIELHKGVVQLGGFVVNAEQSKISAATVARIDGVVSVDNQLHPRPPERSAGQAIDDTLSLARIKQALAEISLGDAWRVNVKVYGGVVLLTGFVASAEDKQRAGDLASSDKNTRSVINGLHVAR